MSVVIDLLRYLATLIDWGIYSLAGFIYEVFCAIATSTIIKAEDVQAFAERIYVVVGVFTLFKVGISMLKYLVNPDQLTDSKGGYNKLIWNITWALILLVSIPTIYDYAMKAQAAILDNGIIPKVILGKTQVGDADSTMKDAGKTMIFTTISAFIMPNYEVTDKNGKYVVLENADVQTCFHTDANGKILSSEYKGLFLMNEGKITEYNPACDAAFKYMTDTEAIDMYKSANQNSDIRQLLDVAAEAKLSDDIQNAAGRGGTLAVKLYFLKYMWGISWIVGAFLCFIFVSFAIDMGIRAIKMAFLVLISPIPVLSMVNADKGARGMLAEWWKVTWATYLDLFLRLVSIFFVIFIIQEVDVTTAIASEFGPVVSAFAMVFLIIGALLFAKQLPELVSKLIPGMDSVVKGGINPLKKLGEAANVASRAPLLGKGVSALSNRFGVQKALNDATKREEAAKRRQKQDEFRRKMNQVKTSDKTEEEKQKELEQLRQQQAEELAQFDRESAERIKAQKEKNKLEAKQAAAGAAAGVSWLGGESKPITSAGQAAAKIKKDSVDRVNKMEKAALEQRQADENLAKVTGMAESERNAAIKEKEKQIVDVQRDQEIEKRVKNYMQTGKFSSESEARSAATRDVQAMEAEGLKAQAVEKRKQAKIAQGVEATVAETQARAEVAAMSATEIASEGSVSKVYSDEVSRAAYQNAKASGKSEAEAVKIGAAAAKKARSAAETEVVGSLSDKMDEVAEREGVLYTSKEYAEQVRITRNAKNRRNEAQSNYEKAARQQQSEGKVTVVNDKGEVITLEGQAAIDHVDDLRVAYTKASSDYDFMNKELDGMSEKYPSDAAVRKGYENAKDYQDKKGKVASYYASKSSQVSDNEVEGRQYTVQDLIQEDTVVNRIRRADTELANSEQTFVARRNELVTQGRIIESQIADNEAAGNIGEVTRLRNELNVNNVEIGRVDTSIEAARIARNNATTYLVGERTSIDSTLSQTERDYEALTAQIDAMTTGGQIGTDVYTRAVEQKVQLETRMDALAKELTEVDTQLSNFGISDPTSVQPSVVIDTRIEGAGKFDRIGTPIRTKIENIVLTMEGKVQELAAAQTEEEKTKLKIAIESALSEYEAERAAAQDSLYSGMTSDTEREVYDKKIAKRIEQIKKQRNNN